MAIQLNDNIKINAGKPSESKYLNTSNAPYTGTSQVFSQIGVGERHVGLTVNVNNVEYWFATGVTNGSLIVKSPSVVAGGGVTGATNGLTKTGAKIKLGGALTGATTIGLGANNLTLTGTTGTLRYGSDLSAQYNVRSLVDKGYVTGLTSQAITSANNGLTKSGTNVRLGGSLTGNTTIQQSDKNLTIDSSGGTFTISNNTQIAIDSTAGSGVDFTGVNGYWNFTDNGTSFGGSFNVDVSSGSGNTGGAVDILAGKAGIDLVSNGAININATSRVDIGGNSGANSQVWIQPFNGATKIRGIDGSLVNRAELNVAASGVTFTDNRVTKRGIEYAANYSANFTPRSLVDKAYVTGLTTTSGVQTASNGLTKVLTDVRLGGSLSANTTIETTLYDFAISGTTGDLSFTNGGNQLMIDAAGISVTLNGSDTLRYSADYSGNYVARSLVDKAYVDSIAAGLDPKASVHLATVAPLTGATYSPTGGVAGSGSFSSAPTIIDGHTLSNGDRILVKNQTDPKQNGIYSVISATGGTWQRASDHDGTPANEVSSGNFTFVQTGVTQTSTGWVLAGNGILTLNTDPLIWNQFSAANSYLGGNGINISGNTIHVDLASNSGLDFSGGALRVNPTIAGDGLTLTSGVLNVGASNGLTANGNDIHLGGTLTGDTYIDGASALYLGTNTPLSAISLVTDGIGEFYSNGGGLYLYDTAGGAVELTSSGGGISIYDQSGANLVKLEHQGTGNVEVRANTGSVTVTSAGGGASLEDTASGDVIVGSTGGETNVYTSVMEIKLGAADAANNSFITDSRTGSNRSGLHYAANYSANFKPRSLVDKGYVTGLTSVLLATANNGLTKSGTNVRLGGTLTGNTSVNGDGNDIEFISMNSFIASSTSNNILTIDDASGISLDTQGSGDLIQISSGGNVAIESTNNIDILSSSGMTLDAATKIDIVSNGGTGLKLRGDLTKVIIEHFNGTVQNQLKFESSGVTFTDNNTNGGIRYAADYSLDFTPRSLVDKAYVTGLTTTSGVQTANNGLTKSGTNVRLGGNLTGATTIGLGVNNLTLTGTTGTLRYGSDLSAQYNVRSLVDKGYVTGLTTSPNLAVAIVTGNTTLTNSNGFVLVTTSGSSITVTLPASPTNGKLFKIKDRSGNAGTNVITVSGNGRNIDGSSTSTINTNYGGTEMIYSSVADAWFITGFVN